MADIFISYSKANRDLALKLSAFFESEGWSVWWDKSLGAGDTYRDEIMKQLASARAVIVIWSETSIKSDWVRAEAGRAKADGKLIPVKTPSLTYADIPLPFGDMHTENVSSLALTRGAVVAQLTKPSIPVSALREIAKSTRAHVVMACGTGKTLLALWVVEQIKPKTVLVLVPSLTLLQQTLDELTRHTSWGDHFSYICVCSDPTVVSKDVNDPITFHRSDAEFRVDTDPKEVRRFLQSTKTAIKVIFSTYQSSAVVSKSMRGLAPVDIAIFDEAHKTTGPMGGLFAHCLSDQNIKIRQRLFLTATPRHYDIRHRDREGDFRIVSMDDEAVYGPRAYTLTFGSAAQQGIICNYKVSMECLS